MRPAGDRLRRGRSPGGFTLLEVLIALAVVVLVVGVSVPAMQRLYASSQYRGAIADVLGLLGSARHTAIRTGQAQDVLVDPRERRVAAGSVEKILPESITLEVLGSVELNRDGAGVIRFYPDGGASGGYVNLLGANGNAVQLQVDWLLGRVTTCTENCEGLAP